MLNDVWSNSCAGITEHNLDLTAFAEITRRNLQLSSVRHRIATIVYEVEKNLMQTVAISRNARQALVERHGCSNVSRFQHRPYQLNQLADRRIDVSEFELDSPAMSTLQQSLHRLHDGAQLGIDYFKPALSVGRIAMITGQ